MDCRVNLIFCCPSGAVPRCEEGGPPLGDELPLELQADHVIVSSHLHDLGFLMEVVF